MSALISRRTDSRTANSFARLKSTLVKPGPTRELRPALPKVPGAGLAKAAGLNHIALLRCDTPELPTTSGYNEDPLLIDDDSPGSIVVAMPDWIIGVNGVPECHWNRVETRQPPTTGSTKRGTANRRPRPTGTS